MKRLCIAEHDERPVVIKEKEKEKEKEKGQGKVLGKNKEHEK